MLTVTKAMPNQGVQEVLLSEIERYYQEARSILVGIPKDINIRFENDFLIEEQGVGGYAYSPDTLTIGFDLEYRNKDNQLVFLRETVFHEAMHLFQGFTKETFKGEPIEEAIHEGIATVFEVEMAGADPAYGKYQDYDKATLDDWIAEVVALKRGYDYKKWKHYNPEIGEKWVLYKVGTYIVERALERTGNNVLELAQITPEKIMELAELNRAK